MWLRELLFSPVRIPPEIVEENPNYCGYWQVSLCMEHTVYYVTTNEIQFQVYLED
jgi:hypothetical protein